MKKPLPILKNQLLNTILMVALTVPLLVVAVTLDHKPTLSFEGARIQVVEDANGEASVQLLFDVCIRWVEGCDGIQFTLNYNPDYLRPSNYDTNEALEANDGWWGNYTDSRAAFRRAPGLYYDSTGADADPFKEPSDKIDHMVSGDTISMYLFLNGNLPVDDTKNTLISAIKVGDGSGDAMNVFVLPENEKLVLGTLSFRVTNPDMMPEITERFDGLTDLLFEQNHAKDVTDDNAGSGDKLIYFKSKGTGDGKTWGIGIYEKPSQVTDYVHTTINDYEPSGASSSRAQAAFTYRFPKTIIKARAAEAELTLNAYQVYTDGRVSDLDAALQKYSPAITVTYSDGSEGNFIMPWGREANATASDGTPVVKNAAGNLISDLPWTATVVYDQNSVGPKPVVVDGVAGSGQITYDPTASRYQTTKENQLYLVEKDFCYHEEDFDGVVRKRTFPIPIKVNLTVTPVTLVDVTADNLARTYLLNDALVDTVNAADRAVQNLSALGLPTQARLVTDVPVGGGTLTMDIPGWSHPQTYSVDGGGTTTLYWPSDNTVPGTGTGTGMIHLWRDDATDTGAATLKTKDSLHWPTSDDLQVTNKWMATETNGARLGANRAGNYTFKMAESYGGSPTDFTKPAIQAVYPWLTIPKDHYPLDDATRTIVWNEDPDKDPDEPRQMETTSYQVDYISTVTAANGQPTLTLQVKKKDDGGNVIHLPDKSEFRIRLPDGTELGIGALTGVTLDNWFADNGSYQKNEARLSEGGSNTPMALAFSLVTNTGNPEQGTFGANREALRRYINLGGWFSVAVKESGDIVEVDNAGTETKRTAAATTTWSDFIPVYVPPRPNYYTESKEYNFIGENAGLYPWPGGLATTVILPPGVYNPVELQGNAVVPVYDPAGSTTRKAERYGVATTYNGETGAQPGELNTFTVDPVPEPSPNDDWRKSGPAAVGGYNVTTYGGEYFKNNALYSTYGRVQNLMSAGDPDSYASGFGGVGEAYTATVRLEEDKIADPAGEERLELQYVDTKGGAPSYNTDGINVTEIIFEPRTQGYTLRQDYTLVLRNVGTVDIDGINLDILTDLTGNDIYDKGLDHAPAGGHFEILKPPASFLPAGESTTFVISYVYDLRSKGSSPMEYRDKIFITSNRRDKVPTGATTLGADYLLDFDAEFQVTDTSIHRVIINVIPAEKDGVPYPMGTAGVIIGPTASGTGGSGTSTVMNKNAGPTAYVKGKDVYILIAPDDEYVKVGVTAVDASGTSIEITALSEYANDKLDADGHLVYHFEMPDYDTTVTVTFNEPISSKLRLSDLRVYASPDKGKHYPYTDLTGAGGRTEWDASKTDIQRRVWQKGFTDAERTTATTNYGAGEGERLYLMTVGKADQPDFHDKAPQYLVVLPYDADFSQVEVDLREVKYIFDQPNDPIRNVPLENIRVQMTLFDSTDVNRMLNTNDTNHNHDIYPSSYEGNPYAGYTLGKTNDPTTHTSIPFDSPQPGTSKYVRVTLNYEDTSGGTAITISRSYYIELHRDRKDVDATLNYGNSPYGMIMNDNRITDKAGAKTIFLNNNYTFSGMGDLTPSVVTAGGLTNIHYWLETWTAPTESWTPPSLDADWTNQYSPSGISVFDPETAMSEPLYKRLRNEDPYQNENLNLDLNDYAFFAIMGEEFLDPGLKSATDSSGRPVDLTKAVLSLEVYTLDNVTTGTDKDKPSGQLSRFALPANPKSPQNESEIDALKARTVTIDFLNDADLTKAAVSGDKVTKDWARWYLTPEGELTREAAAGNTLVELRPGRYRLTYTFPNYNYIPVDPGAPSVDIVPTNDMPDHLTYTRDFVVLAPVGDINADLAVTTGTTDSDEALIEGRLAPDAGYPALGYMAYVDEEDAIFKLRTCDVNNDRNINNIDANTIGKETAVKRYYLPVDYKPAATAP